MVLQRSTVFPAQGGALGWENGGPSARGLNMFAEQKRETNPANPEGSQPLAGG